MINNHIGLLRFTGEHAGCAAKTNPITLNTLLDNLSKVVSASIPASSFLGLENREDVGVFSISATQSIVMNIDAITPIVDDPFVFGKIAVTHTLGDIYAKGLFPAFAMNLLEFPFKYVSPDLAQQILEGAISQLQQANAVMLGGHTMENAEPKFGLAVVAIGTTDKIIRKSTAKANDVLVVTKKLGTGIVATALKSGYEGLSSQVVIEATESMMMLNETAARIINEVGVNACTDITGFGLAVHLYEMIRSSEVAATIDLNALPVFDGVMSILKAGVFPQILHHNMDYLSIFTEGIHLSGAATSHPLFEILFDPQTSGGLLISLPADRLSALMDRFRKAEIGFALIGEITEKHGNYSIDFT
jgi:selenide, water dikinase